MPKYSEEIINFKRLVTILERCFLYLKHNGVNTKFHFFVKKVHPQIFFWTFIFCPFFLSNSKSFPSYFIHSFLQLYVWINS